MQNKIETENILIVASFSNPIYKHEIEQYLSAALTDVEEDEYYDSYSLKGNIHFHLSAILKNNDVRKNLSQLYNLALETDYQYDLYPFYLIYHAWDTLETDNTNYYYEGLDLNNAFDILCKEATYWVETQINDNNPIKISDYDKPININCKSTYIQLEKGFYNIQMIGGWGIKLGGFEVNLLNLVTKRPLELKRTKLPIQSYYAGKRAKIVWNFNVSKKAKFKYTGTNIDTLEVKHGNLKLINVILNKPKLNTDRIEFRIIKKRK